MTVIQIFFQKKIGKFVGGNDSLPGHKHVQKKDVTSLCSPCQKENDACAAYQLCNVVNVCNSMEIRGFGTAQQLLFRGISHEVYSKEHFVS